MFVFSSSIYWFLWTLCLNLDFTGLNSFCAHLSYHHRSTESSVHAHTLSVSLCLVQFSSWHRKDAQLILMHTRVLPLVSMYPPWRITPETFPVLWTVTGPVIWDSLSSGHSAACKVCVRWTGRVSHRGGKQRETWSREASCPLVFLCTTPPWWSHVELISKLSALEPTFLLGVTYLGSVTERKEVVLLWKNYAFTHKPGKTDLRWFLQ